MKYLVNVNVKCNNLLFVKKKNIGQLSIKNYLMNKKWSIKFV